MVSAAVAVEGVDGYDTGKSFCAIQRGVALCNPPEALRGCAEVRGARAAATTSPDGDCGPGPEVVISTAGAGVSLWDGPHRRSGPDRLAIARCICGGRWSSRKAMAW
jgi:hypothetical protein